MSRSSGRNRLDRRPKRLRHQAKPVLAARQGSLGRQHAADPCSVRETGAHGLGREQRPEQLGIERREAHCAAAPESPGCRSSCPSRRSGEEIADQVGDFLGRFPDRAMAEVGQQFQPRIRECATPGSRSSAALPERRAAPVATNVGARMRGRCAVAVELPQRLHLPLGDEHRRGMFQFAAHLLFHGLGVRSQIIGRIGHRPGLPRGILRGSGSRSPAGA